MWLDEIKLGIIPILASQYLFSFIYGGEDSESILGTWQEEYRSEQLDADRTILTTIWTDPKTGLRVHWKAIRYDDFPALEWLLYFENTGTADTPIIQNIQALDLTFSSPISKDTPYRLHKTNGAPSNPTDFQVSTVKR